MRIETATEHYHDPGDSYGHGERTGKVWVCPRCGHSEEYELDEDEQEILDDDDDDAS